MKSISKTAFSGAIAATRSLCAAGLMLFVAGVLSACDGGEPAEFRAEPSDQGPTWVPPPSAMAMPLERLEALENAWAERVSLGGAEGVTSARRAAELARLRALRDPSSNALERARDLLRRASEPREITGACDAALDLARLEARDALDLRAAYLVAYRTTRRFMSGPDSACAAEATRMLGALTGYRPDEAVLFAIDSDPEADPRAISVAEADTSERLTAWASTRSDHGQATTIQSISVYGGEDNRDAEGVRVVMELDHVASFRPQEIQAGDGAPARLAIDVDGAFATPTLANSMVVGAGGLRRVRHARHEHGTRVVFDLEEEANTRFFILPEPFRIVVDVFRNRPTRQDEARTDASEFDLLVLDPGHGGDDYGARAFDLEEADVALDLALRVRAILRERLPRVRVVLTRERDAFVSLEQRAAMANAINADAFVSIHLNASDEAISHGGVTTFVLDTTNERQALRLAARENGASVSEIGDLSRILAGFRREEQVSASRALAERIHLGVLTGGRTVLPTLYDRGVRTAMFYVLVGATMPAVLVEASFMTREDEANALHYDSYRHALADGMAEGIIRWASHRLAH
jgi:N-acetylmuramoyl-L-alanine amidase